MNVSYLKSTLVVGISLLFVVGSFLSVPIPAHAQSSLVVCGVGGTIGTGQNDATGCQACHLFELIDRLIKFLIFLAIPVASLLFAYAGFLYMTQGAHGHSEARAIFTDVLFGFVIALCGFLIVDTIIKTLVNGSFTGPSWKTVQCVSGSARNIAQGGIGFTQLEDLSGLVNTSSAPTVQAQIGTGDCSPSALAGDWGNNATRMSCVINGESTCREIASQSDKGADGTSFSYGRYQINISANQVQCPGQTPLNCPSAFTRPDYKGSLKQDAASQQLYKDCVQAAYTTACSTYTAQQIFNKQGWGAWGADAARGCGGSL